MNRKIFKPLAGAAGIALIVVFAGCSTFTNMRGNTQQGADRRLQGQVQSALKADPTYKFPNVSVSVFRSDVQLGGVVQSENQKNEAVRIAKGVPGVLGVSNHIMITKTPPAGPVQ